MKNILIIGAGISGATLANLLAPKYKITIIDKRNHIAGNCFDYIEDNILISKYGAHIFHTNNEDVWKYVNNFSKFIEWKHKVIGNINNTLFPIPVNINTVNILLNSNYSKNNISDFFEKNKNIYENPSNSKETVINKVGEELYNLIFKDYTFKQWNKYPEELDPSVLNRIPVRDNYEDGYFDDKYQGLPENGYTLLVAKMLAHPNITIKLNTEYQKEMNNYFDYILFTGPIDSYYSNLNLPKLEYRSITFIKEKLDVDYYQSNSVINYPQLKNKINGKIIDTPWTRIVEYKHFYNQKIPNKTIIVKEITTDEGDPYYPVPTKENMDLFKKYQEEAKKDEINNIFFLGRLGSYKYLNMDQAIDEAMKFAKNFLNK